MVEFAIVLATEGVVSDNKSFVASPVRPEGVRTVGIDGESTKRGHMSLRIGDTVDDVSLLRAEGTSVPLSAFSNQALVLIFLRHLA